MIVAESFQPGEHVKMNANDTIRAKRFDDGRVVQIHSDVSMRPLESQTDWAVLEAMTESEIEANAASDPGNPPLTAYEL